VRFALTAASRLDPPVPLGPIHLMKFAYLADWAVAQRQSGESLTQIPWRFYHFGPYCDAIEEDLAKAVGRGSAEDRSFYGFKSGRDVKRWSVEQDEAADEEFLELERRLPFEATAAIQRALRSHGNATNPLLHEVYSTLPMRCTAPGELIDFAAAMKMLLSPGGDEPLDPRPKIPAMPEPAQSATQMKRREAAFDLLRQRMEEARARSKGSQNLVFIDPVEDEVFSQGVHWLDQQMGEAQPFTGNLTIDQSVWNSAARRSVQ